MHLKEEKLPLSLLPPEAHTKRPENVQSPEAGYILNRSLAKSESLEALLMSPWNRNSESRNEALGSAGAGAAATKVLWVWRSGFDDVSRVF